MNGVFEVGTVTLRAYQRALETMANNIANTNTPAFKRTDPTYAEVASELAPPVVNAAALEQVPQAAGGVRMVARQTVGMQGELRASSDPLDIAIDGRGYIQLMGSEGQTLLWRGGKLSIDRDGHLAAEGGALRALIAVPDDATGLQIARDGTVFALLADGQPVELGQIGLVRVDHDADLERAGAGLFKVRDEARVTETAAGEDGSGTIAQGMIEQSNVDFSAAMVQMLVVQRAYAASAQIVQAADQLASISNNLKR